jgi:anti-sigma factor RsiW
MTHSLQHAFEAEEVMAYLDGALEPERAAALASHLDVCSGCQDIAKSFRQLSDRMLSFEIEPVPHALQDPLTKALDQRAIEKPAPRATWNRFDFWNWPVVRRVPRIWTITVGSLAVVALFVFLARPNLLQVRPEALSKQHAAYNTAPTEMVVQPSSPAPPLDQALSVAAREYQQVLERKRQAALSSSLENNAEDRYTATVSQDNGDSNSSGGQLAAPEVSGPMIEQNISLHIVPNNYDDASATIEKLASAHGGYIGNLSATAQTGSARDVSVELRIPAKQADAFIADVRKLGKVVEETRTADEVTAQYVDLQARLKAAKAAEQRLVELLGTRTGKLSDVLEVERELARVRSEIESMQGQSNLILHQVNYATVKVELSEEYHETLRTDATIGSKIRNAFVAGLKNLRDGVVGALVFLLEDGLSLAFWGGLILGIALLLRKRIRARRAVSTTPSIEK